MDKEDHLLSCGVITISHEWSKRIKGDVLKLTAKTRWFIRNFYTTSTQLKRNKKGMQGQKH